MSRTVDARGLACPKPVIETRAALADSEVVVTIVDNEVARNNVTKMAESKGCSVEVGGLEGEFRLTITKGEATAEGEPGPTPGAPAEAGPMVVILGADEMGRGEPDLGRLLIRTFLQTLGELEPLPSTIICLNTGVRLTVEGALTVESLQTLTEAGVQLLVCGTCLDFFGLKDEVAVGEVSNMFTIVETLAAAGNVVTV